jgi:renalase
VVFENAGNVDNARASFVNNHAIPKQQMGNDDAMQDILIIGAGVAGLTVARELQKAGRDVLLLEKSRGLGGRSATRTINGSRVDHGAQYFTVRDEKFQEQVNQWLEQGHLKVWSHGFHRLTDKGLENPTSGNPRYVFPKGMNMIGKLLGEGLEVRTGTKVTRVQPKQNAWEVSSETGETFEAKSVILNMPAEQALNLCNFDLGDIRGQLERVVMDPCFALMLGYEKNLAPDWQGLHVEVPSSIAWISHDSSKRLLGDETVLVVHSTPQFARAHFEENLETVKANMLSAFSLLPFPHLRSNFVHFPLFSSPLWTDLQRWKYALASSFLGQPFVQHDSLYFCGDWCGGARLEAAYGSGLELAKHLSSFA